LTSVLPPTDVVFAVRDCPSSWNNYGPGTCIRPRKSTLQL
jgi:hypothetical protein